MEEKPGVNSQGSLAQLIHLHFKNSLLLMQRMRTAGASVSHGCFPGGLRGEGHGTLGQRSASKTAGLQQQPEHGSRLQVAQTPMQHGGVLTPSSAAGRGRDLPRAAWRCLSSGESKARLLACAAGAAHPAMAPHREGAQPGAAAALKIWLCRFTVSAPFCS